VPFGILLARLFGLGDLRQVGSGNIGATNVLRTGNKAAAALTLLLDGVKGAAAVLVLQGWGDPAMQAAGLGALLGHCFPVWLRFRGGKGVSTFLGVMLALAWIAGVAVCLTWLAAAALSRRSSVGALAAAASAPVWAVVVGRLDLVALAIVLAALVWGRHHANIARLIAGTEPQIGNR
jgi:glycerol-3-phosphate acyltransferase PlsY